jgi:hypothetical protein
MDFEQLKWALEHQGNPLPIKERQWLDPIPFTGADTPQGIDLPAVSRRIQDLRESIEMRPFDNNDDSFNPHDFDCEISREAPALDGKIDFAAVYWPITAYGDIWGIGIRSSAVDSLAKNILVEAGQTRLKGPLGYAAKIEAELLAIWIYFLHEQYHHKVEMFALRQQLLSGTAFYKKYHRDIYEKTFLTNDCFEEALANVDKRDQFKKKFASKSYAKNPWAINENLISASQRVIKRMIQTAPPGYSEAQFLQKKFAIDEKTTWLAQQVLTGEFAKTVPGIDLMTSDKTVEQLMKPLSDLAERVEMFPDASAPLDVMALSNPTYRSLGRYIEKELGGVHKKSGHTGDHKKYEIPGMDRTMPLQRHNMEVPDHVLKQLAHAKGMSVGQFRRLVREKGY